MNTDYYEFFCPVKIISGFKALCNLPYEMEQLGARKALVITDKGVSGAGLISRVEAAFDGSDCEIAHIYTDTPPDSSTKVVKEVADLFREKGCDCFVAVGGGSCMDTAKAANIMVTEDTEDLLRYQGAERLKKSTRPFIAVPTTAGTGSEVTLVAVVHNSETHVKMAFTSYQLYPKVAILDPKMTLTMPPKITAATGMDALTHAIEAYYCLQKNPVSDAFAISALELVMANLLKCVENGGDEQARLNMANGALLAGIAFSNSMVGVVHSLAHGAGGVARLPHGLLNAIFLPWGMEYNLDKRAAQIAELAPYLGVEELSGDFRKDAEAAVAAVRSLNAKLNEVCGLPTSLKEAGVAEEQLSDIAKAAINDGSLTFNPEEVTLDDALSILKKAF